MQEIKFQLFQMLLDPSNASHQGSKAGKFYLSLIQKTSQQLTHHPGKDEPSSAQVLHFEKKQIGPSTRSNKFFNSGHKFYIKDNKLVKEGSDQD